MASIRRISATLVGMSNTPATSPDEAFGMVVRFTLREGAADAFDDLMRETVAKIRTHEPNTVSYIVHHVPGDPSLRIFYELYADVAAFEHHENQDYIQYFLAEREKFTTDVQVDRLGVVTAAGVGAGLS